MVIGFQSLLLVSVTFAIATIAGIRGRKIQIDFLSQRTP